MRVFGILGFCLLISLSYADEKPFGDAVAKCAAQYQAPVNSLELQQVFAACEKGRRTFAQAGQSGHLIVGRNI